MYNNIARIQKELDAFELGFFGKLDPDNRWVRMSGLIPWELLEPEYTHHFNNNGRPAKRFRVALGTLIIQETKKLTDRETVQEISENPYMQFFLGFRGFEARAPFDSSLLVYFRKRLNWENIAKINDSIARLIPETEVAENNDKDDKQDPESGSVDEIPKSEEKPEEKAPVQGVLIVDATCTPADIRHPQDLSLLDEARRKTEMIIDALHALVGGEKPRDYRIKARQDFLSVIRKRRKDAKLVQKAIGKQLRYLRRNLRHINELVQRRDADMGIGRSVLSGLSAQHYRSLLIIQEVYSQQLFLYEHQTKSVANRIVSIRQPHIRPIVRGKARSDVEFGAKVSVACSQGLVFVDRISFDAYSESHDIELHAEAYRKRTGKYPASILADKAYQNRANRQWCEERGIRLMGQKLGRPFESPIVNRLLKRIERINEIDRIEIEGRIGIQKRRYGWDLIKGRTPQSAMTMIMMVTLVANLAHQLRGVLLSFIVCCCKAPITIKKSWALGWKLGTFLPALV